MVPSLPLPFQEETFFSKSYKATKGSYNETETIFVRDPTDF